jgi:histidine ammonia-lyase
MGPIAARKTLKILDNLEKILGIELVCACQAMDFRRPLKSSPILEQVHAHVRLTIPFIQDDTVLSPLLNEGIRILQSREILKIVTNT